MQQRRFFWGCKVHAPWPMTWPEGRIIEEKYRHYTLIFLRGNTSVEKEKIPLPPFPLGPCGFFDEVLFLPEEKSRVIAWKVSWRSKAFQEYQTLFCKTLGYQEPTKPHVTVCRSPKSLEDWKKAFHPLPCYIESLHLYEGLGFSKYRFHWDHFFVPPFEEMEHTADLAFRIRGSNWQDLYENAFTALAFQCPAILSFRQEVAVHSIEEIVKALNQAVSHVDTEVGCSFKAVSFHGEARQMPQFLEWEMIVDI